jgi:hypothetical protein
VVYPLARGSGPLITAGAGGAAAGRTSHALGAIGVLAVCGGVFLIAGGPASGATRTTLLNASAHVPACAGA